MFVRFQENGSPPTQNSNQAEDQDQEHEERILCAIGQRDIAQFDQTMDLTLVHWSTPAREREPILEKAELVVLVTMWFPGQIGNRYHAHEEQVGRKETWGYQEEKLRNQDLWNSLFGLGIECMYEDDFFWFLFPYFDFFLEVFYVVCHLRDVCKNKESIESDESTCHII